MRTLVRCLLGMLLFTAPVSAAIVVNDTFDDGARTNGADPNDIAWYKTSSTTVVTVNAQPEQLMTGNSMFVDSGNTFLAALGHFPSQTLANVGDTLTLKFDFRLFSAATTATSTVPEAQAAAAGLRIGLFNSSTSTLTTTDNTPTPSNTYFGYRGEILVGGSGTGTPAIASENGTSPAVLTGSDSQALSSVTGTMTRILDTDVYSASYQLVRTATGVNVIQSVYAGAGGTGTLLGTTTGSDTGAVNNTNSHTGFFDTFDTVAFSSGGIDFSYRLDNIQVDFTTAVPEPSTILLGLGTVAALLVKMKRR